MATVAGSGERGPEGAPLAEARIGGVQAMAVDGKGNLLFSEWPAGGLRLVNVGSETIAGVAPGHVGRLVGGAHGCRPGPVATAELGNPRALALDTAGNVYISDAKCRVIWRLEADYSRVTLLAGEPGVSAHVDGEVATARFRRPRGLTMGLDGQLYLTDYDAHVVRRVSLAGEVTTVAGAPNQNGLIDGAGSVARFARPVGLVMNAQGSLFVGEWESRALRQISQLQDEDPTVTSVISAVGSPGTCGQTTWAAVAESKAPPGSPAYMTMAVQGDAPIVPFWNEGVWRVNPPAAEGEAWTFDHLLDVKGVIGVAIAGQRLWTGGWVHGRDGHNMIRQYDLGDLGRGHIRSIGVPGQLPTQDGAAATATFNMSNCGGGVAVDSDGNIWVAERCADRVRKISSDGVVQSFGSGKHGAKGGAPEAAEFCHPSALAVVGTDVFVVNQACGSKVMRIDTTANTVEVRQTICPASEPICPSPASNGGLAADGDGNLFVTTSYASGAGKLEQYGTSCSDAMDLLVKVPELGNGAAVVFAGTPNNPADSANRNKCVDGAPGTGQFGGNGGPHGIAADPAGSLYVADTACGVRKVDAAGAITTVTDKLDARGVAFDDTGGRPRLYVANGDHTIQVVDLESGAVSLLAGAQPSYGEHYLDGLAAAALFWRPTAVAVDPQGNVVVLDKDNDRIRIVYP